MLFVFFYCSCAPCVLTVPTHPVPTPRPSDLPCCSTIRGRQPAPKVPTARRSPPSPPAGSTSRSPTTAADGARPAPAAGYSRPPPSSSRSTATTAPPPRRSEEHTTALPSLMRNSYAVFCLKQKTTPTIH